MRSAPAIALCKRVVLVRKIANRFEKLPGKLDKGNEHADRKRTGHGLQPPEPDDQAKRCGRYDVHHRPEERKIENGLDLSGAVLVVDAAETLHLLPFPVERLHDVHARNMLLQERIEPRHLFARLPVLHAHLAAKLEYPVRHGGHHGQHDQRQHPVQGEHEIQDEGDPEQVADNDHHARRQYVAERLHVARRPRDQPTDRRAIEETKRLPLDMAKNLRAQVIDRMLPDPLRQISLHERKDTLADQGAHQKENDPL